MSADIRASRPGRPYSTRVALRQSRSPLRALRFRGRIDLPPHRKGIPLAHPAGWSPEMGMAPAGPWCLLSDCPSCTRQSGVKDCAAPPSFGRRLSSAVRNSVPPLAASGGRVARSLTPRVFGAVSFRQKAKGDFYDAAQNQIHRWWQPRILAAT